MQFPVAMISTVFIMSLALTSVASGGAPELSSNDGSPSDFDQQNIVQEVFPAARRTGPSSSHFKSLTASEYLTHDPPRTYSAENPLEANLDGYYIITRYSDGACTAPVYAEATLLNTCIVDTFNDSIFIMIATATSFVLTFFSDAACTRVTSTRPAVPYSKTCTASGSSYVSSSSDVPSTATMATLRF